MMDKLRNPPIPLHMTLRLLIPLLALLAAGALAACVPLQNLRAEEWRWAAAEPEPGPGPLDSGPRVRVFVAPEFRELMLRLEPRYEAEAGVDLELVFDAHLDLRAAEDQLILRAARGAAPDLLLLESAGRITDLTHRPRAWAPFAIGEIVAIAPAQAPVAPRDMLEGTVPVAIALERCSLGRASRLALERAGAWKTASASVGRFDHADAIAEYIAHAGKQDPPTGVAGLVYRSAAARAMRAETEPRRRISIVGALRPPPDEPCVHAMAVWTDAGWALGEWLRSPQAQGEMRRLGFAPLAPGSAGAAWRTVVTLDDELLRTGAP
jgi:ABC-type molybdate transport system substrate-binding protein